MDKMDGDCCKKPVQCTAITVYGMVLSPSYILDSLWTVNIDMEYVIWVISQDVAEEGKHGNMQSDNA